MRHALSRPSGIALCSMAMVRAVLPVFLSCYNEAIEHQRFPTSVCSIWARLKRELLNGTIRPTALVAGVVAIHAHRDVATRLVEHVNHGFHM